MAGTESERNESETENDGHLDGDNVGGIGVTNMKEGVVTNMTEDVEEKDFAGDQKDGTTDEVKNECGIMKCEQEIPTPSRGTNEKQSYVNLIVLDTVKYMIVWKSGYQ